MSSPKDAVGLIGLGLLGQALARRLLHAGYEVIGFDIDPAKNAALAKNWRLPRGLRWRGCAALQLHRARGVQHRTG